MRLVAFLGVLVACYAPHALPGAPCDPTIGDCPSGQTCTAHVGGFFCALAGSASDAMPARDGILPDGLEPDGPPDAACADVVTGLMGLWRFDEGSGTTVSDSSGGSNNGVIAGATWTTGTSGAALAFDGSASYVSIAGTSALKPTSAISFGAWIRTPGVDQGFVIDRQKSLWTSYALQVVGNGSSARARCMIGYDATANSYDVDSTVTVGDNSWHFVMCTYDRTRVRVFVDGTLSNSTPATSSIYYDSSIPFFIGFHFEPDTHFTGTIDEVRVYNRALDGCDIQALANL